MDERSAGIVVVGAGQAGAALVARLRALGHVGPLALVGAEPDPPYQRPPLSKAYLKGEMERERLYLRPPSFYAEAGIDLMLGRAVARNRPCRAAGDLRRRHAAALRPARPHDRLRAAPSRPGPGRRSRRRARHAQSLRRRCPRAGHRRQHPGADRRRRLHRSRSGGGAARERARRHPDRGRPAHSRPRRRSRPRRITSATCIAVTASRSARGRRSIGSPATRAGSPAAHARGRRHDLRPTWSLVGHRHPPRHRRSPRPRASTASDGILVDAIGRTSDPAIFAAGDCARFPHHGRPHPARKRAQRHRRGRGGGSGHARRAGSAIWRGRGSGRINTTSSCRSPG